MTTTVKTSIPSKRMSKDQIDRIARRIADMALKPEADALSAQSASFDERITALFEAAVTDDMFAGLPAAYRPTRSQERLGLNYRNGTYHSRTFHWFTPTRPIYRPVNMSYGELPLEAMNLIPTTLVDEIIANSAAKEELTQRHRALMRELHSNLTAARTVRNACQLWPEAESVILELTDIAAEVEVPLEAILGRYLKALPAPDAANDNATDDQSAVAN